MEVHMESVSLKRIGVLLVLLSLFVAALSAVAVAYDPIDKDLDAESQYDYGMRAYTGVDRITEVSYTKDHEEALQRFYYAAVKGNAKAQNKLGEMYESGDSVRKDLKTATKWYRLAADHGDKEAQANLGRIFFEAKNLDESMRWYGLAAKQGNAVAQDLLGGFCRMEKNYGEAAKWYRLAADQGDADAQNNLALMLEKGEGVQQDFAEAASLYRSASKKGHKDAKFNLGRMYVEDKIPSEWWEWMMGGAVLMLAFIFFILVASSESRKENAVRKGWQIVADARGKANKDADEILRQAEAERDRIKAEIKQFASKAHYKYKSAIEGCVRERQENEFLRKRLKDLRGEVHWIKQELSDANKEGRDPNLNKIKGICLQVLDPQRTLKIKENAERFVQLKAGIKKIKPGKRKPKKFVA